MRHTIYTENKKHKQTVGCPLSLSLYIYIYVYIFSSLNVLPWAKRPATGDHMLHEHHAEDHQKETELGIGHLYAEKRSNQESAESNSSNLQQKEGCRRFFSASLRVTRRFRHTQMSVRVWEASQNHSGFMD